MAGNNHGPKARRRDKAARLRLMQRRLHVGELFLHLVAEKHPRPQREIAARLGVHESQICRDLDALYDDWRALCAATVDKIVAGTLAELDWVKTEARQEWERSKRSAERVTTKQQVVQTGVGPDGTPRVVRGRLHTDKTSTERCGDPRYLAAIVEAEDKKIRLTVGYQPAKIAPTNPAGTEPYEPNWSEAIARKLDAMERNLAAAPQPGRAPGAAPGAQS